MPEDIEQNLETPVPQPPPENPEVGDPEVATGFNDPIPGKPGARVATDPAAPPAYTPNLKYKVMGQEKQFDDFVKGAIKDEKTEKAVRELYEKAYGLDTVKPKLAATRQQLQTMEAEKAQTMSFIGESVAYRDAGDFASLFAAWKIPVQKVAEWLYREMEMNDAKTPPHIREAYRNSQAATRENIRLSRENANLNTQSQESSSQTRAVELQAVMSRPDVTSVMNEVDGRTGKAGTFYQMVVNHALATFQRERRDLSAEEAVTEVLAIMGKMVQPPPQAGAVPPPVVAGAAPPRAPAAPRPATIPKVTGSGAQPVRKGVRSIEDLKAIRKEKFPDAA